MFFPIKSVLEKTLKPATWQIQLTAQWPIIVGNLSDKISLDKIQGDTITIGVHEPSWIQELYMLSSVILKTINNHLGSPRIKKIFFRHTTKHTVTSPVLPQDTAPQKRKQFPLTETEKQTLLLIKDDELKHHLASFLSRCKERKSQ